MSSFHSEETKYKKRKPKMVMVGRMAAWWKSFGSETILFFFLFFLMNKIPPLKPNESWRSELFSEYIPPHPWYRHLLESRIKAGLENAPEPLDLWTNPDSEGWVSCVERAAGDTLPEKSTGYVQFFLEGGLNQQRIGICNAVAVARILNATLLLPEFDVNPVWQDTSAFADIFDVPYFIAYLREEVRVATELPAHLRWSTREYYATAYRETRIKDAIPRATPSWYLENVLPKLLRHGIVAIAPFSHRLAFDGLPEDIQRLRCRVNYEALRFVPAIRNLGDILIHRLRTGQRPSSSGVNLASDKSAKGQGGESKRLRKLQSRAGFLGKYFTSSKTEEEAKDGAIAARGAGPVSEKYIALHLRFDKDMVAHSNCDYGGGRAQRVALQHYRRFAWPDGIPNRSVPSDKLRVLGKCPLTPEEIGLLLAGIGFTNKTRLYLATYMVYGGEERMKPLRELFPLMENKSTLTTDEDLRPLAGHSSRLAALDYYISLHSDVFISASAGNMYNVLAGHRAFSGVKKTIKPYPQMISKILSNRSVSWVDFRRQMAHAHSNRTGALRFRNPGQSIYTYPAPDCMCQRQERRDDESKKLEIEEDEL